MNNVDNVSVKLGDELRKSSDKKTKINICAAYFSMYAFSELKNELENIKEFNFLFNSPTFLEKGQGKEEKKFYISDSFREKTVAGGKFELRLRNSLKQREVAKECRKWIEKKGKFKTLRKDIQTNDGFFLEKAADNKAYIGADSFTLDGLGYSKNDEKINKIYPEIEGENAKQYIDQFKEIWEDQNLVKDITDQVVNYVSFIHKENPAEYIYLITLYNIFNEFLEDLDEENLANEKTGFKDTKIWNSLYKFQKDAFLGIINKLEEHNGCVLADSVGLGKTFTALGAIKYFELRNKRVLVVCPKRLNDNWENFKGNYDTNPLIEDKFNYDVLFHTDLQRERGTSNGTDLSKINWGNYDLVVIDESHNFRNDYSKKEGETRYDKLMRKVIKQGVKTKVLMLSATPVNNRFGDLKSQLKLAYEGDSSKFSRKLGLKKDIEKVFNEAQKEFKKWSKLSPDERTSKKLLDHLDFDFFKVLDSVTIARSRDHIINYYDTSEIGAFPKKKKPSNKSFKLTDIEGFMEFEGVFENLSSLNLKTYTPSEYILPQKKQEYENKYDTILSNDSSLKQSTRETGIMQLMRVNLLKRLESSIESFRTTIEKLHSKINAELDSIKKYKNGEKSGKFVYDESSRENLSEEEESEIGDKVKIKIGDMDYLSWEKALYKDKEILSELLKEVEKIDPSKDEKLKKLKDTIEYKINNPINQGNKKVVIFSAYKDTAQYIYDNISEYFKQKYGMNLACITGSETNKTTLKKINNNMDNILTYFSPKSKQKEKLSDRKEENIDILVATDCISEGQNLQDCDYLINYDIHWNPVRIIQRFGRIDRIGSDNEVIQLVNFWPPLDLDEYINLKARVENKMHALNLAATGQENLLSNQDEDLSYRRKQLERLQEEAVDLEEMNTGVSITDLGLNDFRMDLINYDDREKLEKSPLGLHTVVRSNNSYPGAIFILKNVNENVNINNMNRLHPFYLVYVCDNGEIITNHLESKKTLDYLRMLCKEKKETDLEATKEFNKETNEGSKMKKYSDLLQKAIDSIISVKNEKEVSSIFKSGGTSIGKENIKGLNDFELISFVVVK